MKQRTWLVGLSTAVALAAAVLVYALSQGEDGQPRPASPIAAPTATVSPTPTPSPTQTRPPVPHDRVPASVPLSFRIKGSHFTIDADVCQMDYVRPLNPPGDQLRTVCWVKDEFGYAPGNPSRGTSYILGHSWAAQQLVFNPLSEYAMNHLSPKQVLRSGVVTTPVRGMKGYRITLRTETGVLTYTVSKAYTVAKGDAAQVVSLMDEDVRNRVVLITCGVKDGVDVDVNVIVYAYLSSSRRLPT